jgi:hypothetical protein
LGIYLKVVPEVAMIRRRIALIVVALAVLAFVGALAWKRCFGRPAGVPATATLVDGHYIDCIQISSMFGVPCKVYDGTGKLVDITPLPLRLGAFSKQQGGSPIDCGKTSSKAPDAKVAECVQAAFRHHSPFTAQYIIIDFGAFTYAYGIAGNSGGSVVELTYDSRGFPNIPPNKRTQLLDGNRIRLTSCVEPVSLGIDAVGVVGCVTPVNEAASAITQSKPVDTNICAILEDPGAFNNRLVRLKASYSGNFEYSMLSEGGCSESIWFDYASDDSPPGLAVHVAGGATPGAEDERGWRIHPLPVSLVRDENFKRFQRLMKARVEAEERAERLQPGGFVSYRVTATFVGRLDAVSREIREFHKNRSEHDRADFLGFGQMGLFDAQLIMQSVEDDAVLERER